MGTGDAIAAADGIKFIPYAKGDRLPESLANFNADRGDGSYQRTYSARIERRDRKPTRIIRKFQGTSYRFQGKYAADAVREDESIWLT